MDRLTKLTDEAIEALISFPDDRDEIDANEVRLFLPTAEGLTEAEALTLLDQVRDRRGWNLTTYMTCAEGLAEMKYGCVHPDRLN